ncbi:MAG: septal ring lytic transglycosylase RlpA family protein [Balneolaceae bacterium]|nr:MAG: septal ring lytic transglycosylase RlpA family protein [Balneolaceae bacterium]
MERLDLSDEDLAVLGDGIASWYGPGFHGKATANGETYNMNDLTAAHRTLPFNTVVRVNNLDNGRSVTVRINDRGPYVDNRIIDLSRRAAQDIEMIGPGIANVQLFLVREGDRPVTPQNASSRETFTVQIGSFERESDARAKAASVRGSRVEQVNLQGRTVFRVYYGTYATAEEARVAQRQLQTRGISGFVKQAEN